MFGGAAASQLRVIWLNRIRGLPTSYFVDQNGVIIGKQVGPVDEAWMKRYLAQTGVE